MSYLYKGVAYTKVHANALREHMGSMFQHKNKE